MGTEAIYGYIRVNTRDQNGDRQHIALRQAAADCGMPVGTFCSKAVKLEQPSGISCGMR